MTEAVILAFIISFFKGYRWKIFNLFKHWSIYPIVLTCLLHIYFVYLMIQGEYWFMEYAGYIKSLSLLFYFVLIWQYKLIDISMFKSINLRKDKNVQIWVWLTSPVVMGGLCIVIGSILNKIAMFYNNNKMPVFVSNSWATGYVKADMFTKAVNYGDFPIMGDMHTKLIPICDTWDVGYMVFSPGDILIRMFVFFTVYYSVKQLSSIKEYYIT